MGDFPWKVFGVVQSESSCGIISTVYNVNCLKWPFSLKLISAWDDLFLFCRSIG